jgi:hypothetical protein
MTKEPTAVALAGYERAILGSFLSYLDASGEMKWDMLKVGLQTRCGIAMDAAIPPPAQTRVAHENSRGLPDRRTAGVVDGFPKYVEQIDARQPRVLPSASQAARARLRD